MIIARAAIRSAGSDARTPAVIVVPLDVWLSIAQDAAAAPAARRKAAAQVAECLLPKYFGRKKSLRGKFPADEYGFVIDPRLARELRDLHRQCFICIMPPPCIMVPPPAGAPGMAAPIAAIG